MKKIYSLIVTASFLFAANGFAQNKRVATGTTMKPIITQAAEKNQPSVLPMNINDTITGHWQQIFCSAGCDTPVTYSTHTGICSGGVIGQNEYGDLGKAQRFDSTDGIASLNGTITNLLLWVGKKCQGAGTATWIPTIWADAAGKPGAVLGSATAVTVASMDTSLAGHHLIGPASAVRGLYNVNATFSPAITMPANHIFWAGFKITYAAGDSAALVTTTGTEYANAATHTMELNTPAPGTWVDVVTDWNLKIALAVYPVVSATNTGINEANATVYGLQNFPNPANSNTTINYSLKETANVELSLFDVTGKKLSSLNQGMQTSGNHQLKLDVSDLSSGIYFYTISAGDYKLTNKMSVVK